MRSFKEFLKHQGIDVETLQKKTWSAKQAEKMIKELAQKYRKPARETGARSDPKRKDGK